MRGGSSFTREDAKAAALSGVLWMTWPVRKYYKGPTYHTEDVHVVGGVANLLAIQNNLLELAGLGKALQDLRDM